MMIRQKVYIDITIKFNSPEFKVKTKEGHTLVFVTERPQENKVNREIIKNFEKMLGGKVTIAKGAKSRKKTIRVEGIAEDVVRQKLNYNIYRFNILHK